MVLAEFQMVGSDLFLSGLVTSHGGNLSLRQGGRLAITRRGAMLGHLSDRDLVETGLHQDDEATELASSELPVHRAIYRRTGALAVVHAHPLHAVALSVLAEEIVPVDVEGSSLLRRVPVVAVEQPAGSPEVAEAVAGALRERPIVMVRGHGCFSRGETLEQAHHWCSTLEASARVLYYLRILTGRAGHGPGDADPREPRR